MKGICKYNCDIESFLIKLCSLCWQQGDMVAKLFILPRAWIHYLLQMERFHAVRDFQLPIQSCNRQFSGISHFIVIATFKSRQYPLVSHVACDWCVWVLAIIINKNLRLFHKLHLVKWSVPAARYSMRMLLHYTAVPPLLQTSQRHNMRQLVIPLCQKRFHSANIRQN